MAEVGGIEEVEGGEGVGEVSREQQLSVRAEEFVRAVRSGEDGITVGVLASRLGDGDSRALLHHNSYGIRERVVGSVLASGNSSGLLDVVVDPSQPDRVAGLALEILGSRPSFGVRELADALMDRRFKNLMGRVPLLLKELSVLLWDSTSREIVSRLAQFEAIPQEFRERARKMLELYNRLD